MARWLGVCLGLFQLSLAYFLGPVLAWMAFMTFVFSGFLGFTSRVVWACCLLYFAAQTIVFYGLLTLVVEKPFWQFVLGVPPTGISVAILVLAAQASVRPQRPKGEPTHFDFE